MTATIAKASNIVTTVFKGFNIYELDGRFSPQNKGEAVFKADGYATMAGAKGAITKYFNAKLADIDITPISADEPGLQVIEVAAVEKMKDTMLAPSAKAVEVATSAAKLESETARAIAAVQAMASARAVRPSRNKREGRYDGNTGGRAVRMHNNIPGLMSFRPYPANRKQRKATAIASKGGM